MHHLIAIDGGGTGCRALVADGRGAVLGRGESGAANIMSDPDAALAHIVEAAGSAAVAAGLSAEILARAHAVLGLAGANVGDHAARLTPRLPFAGSLIATDIATAARGALGPHDGAVAILGTGSVFAAQTNGRVRTVGGWGFALGDQASGAWLGRKLLERTLLAHDGVAAGSPLTAEILTRFNGDPGAIVDFAHGGKPGDFARFAPLVFEKAAEGDPVAKALIAEGVAEIEAALSALMPPGCDRLCLLGGLAAAYAGSLGVRFAAMLHEPLGSALDGALAMALERFSSGEGGSHG